MHFWRKRVYEWNGCITVFAYIQVSQTLRMILQSGCTRLGFQQQCLRVPVNPQPHRQLVHFSFHSSHSGGCGVVSFFAPACISLMTNDVRTFPHSYVYWPFRHPLWWSACLDLLPILNQIVCLFLIDLWEFCIYSGLQSFVGYMYCKYHPQMLLVDIWIQKSVFMYSTWCLAFLLLLISFDEWSFHWNIVQIINFSLF